MLAHIARVARSLIRERAKRRSAGWPIVERAQLARQPVCAACGGSRVLQVHHVEPFHLHPELELDPRNLITLCMGPWECHLRIGHGGSFEAYNPHVRADAAAVRAEPARRAVIESHAKAGRLRA